MKYQNKIERLKNVQDALFYAQCQDDLPSYEAGVDLALKDFTEEELIDLERDFKNTGVAFIKMAEEICSYKFKKF